MRNLGYILLAAAAAMATGCHSGRGEMSHSHSHETEEADLHDLEGNDHEGHDHEGHSHEGHDHESSEENHSSDEIVFPHAKAYAAGVKTEKLASTDFYGVLPVGGKVLAASGDEAAIVSTVAGVVRMNRNVSEGMPVGRGDAIASVSTSSMPEGDVSTRARVEYENAKAEYDRAERLVSDKIISEKEYQAAKARLATAKLAYDAVEAKTTTRGVAMTSPIGGYVKECFVKEGDYVDVGQPIATVTSSKRLRLRAEVPERDYGMLSKVVSAKFRTSASDRIYDLRDLNGKLLSYGRTAGAESTFVPVVFEFDNVGDVISGSFAEIFLLTSPTGKAITVPVSALNEEMGVYYVYERLDDDCYRRRIVKKGMTDGDRIEIVSGLKGDEEIVTEGAVHVRLASASHAIPGHTHNH